jgi:hypothetical protein
MHHGGVLPQMAQGLLALRKRIAARKKVVSSQLDETISVAFWNIANSGKFTVGLSFSRAWE